MGARKIALIVPLMLAVLILSLNMPAPRRVIAQQPTGSIPTVTGTPSGPTIAVDPSLGQIDVYAGPSSYNYPAIGVLLTGVRVPALGRARDDDKWILISYPGVPGSIGWVYALYVSLTGGSNLPLIDSPATPTPGSTPTINPTLVAAFIPLQASTSLPTFTAAAPLAIPAFLDPTQHPTRVPAGLLILGFAAIGALGTLISFLRGR